MLAITDVAILSRPPLEDLTRPGSCMRNLIKMQYPDAVESRMYTPLPPIWCSTQDDGSRAMSGLPLLGKGGIVRGPFQDADEDRVFPNARV